MRVFQILISDKPVTEDRFSPDLKRNIASLKATYPEADYVRYGDEELLQFLADEYPKEVLEAYTALTAFAFKADLARLCLLHHYGGVYSDLSYFHLRPMALPKDKDMIAFRDIAGHPSWATSNGMICARAGAPQLARAIDRIVAHHKALYYGQHPLDPTGPFMFGRVLCEGEDWPRVAFGDSRSLGKDAGGRNQIAKILPGGEIVAIRNKDRDCCIDEMVKGHSNHYVKIWESGRLWSEPGIVTRLRSKILP
ncbi:glycosyltransferase family 32 protein [Shimia sp. FJ5]|uniref:glycosyltransferase family 32 protein n=1 Tax=Shimia sp. FJ5 TaxID=3079054 RepID=UPI002601E34A|nr:glycosyltransferase [Shimia sp. FJ5]MDV4145548.1 glycosyltransferase [Shimia sp. FJ5]